MAAIANLVLSDFASVAHTLTPVGIDSKGVASWREVTTDPPTGWPKASLQVRPAAVAGGNFKVTAKLVKPVLTGTIYDGTKFITATVEFIIPDSATLTNRKDAHSQIVDWISETMLRDAVWNFDTPY